MNELERPSPKNRGNLFVLVFLMLCGLTALSFWISRSHLMDDQLTGWAAMMAVSIAKALLVALFLTQLLLGVGTWVTNFGWPLWFRDYVWPLVYTVVAEGRLQVVTTTAHAAVGSLNLVVAVSLALWSRRLFESVPR